MVNYTLLKHLCLVKVCILFVLNLLLAKAGETIHKEMFEGKKIEQKRNFDDTFLLFGCLW